MGEDAVQRGLAWIAGMQSENGGWGAFDADNTSTWLYKLPFCDFGAVIDPPSEDVSAHALEVLAQDSEYAPVVRRGLHYLLGSQQRDGSWWGRWGVNHLYGTAATAAGAGGVRHRPRSSRSGAGRGLARLRAASRRRLRRGHPLVSRARLAGTRRPHGFTNRVGASSLRRRRQGARNARQEGGGLSLWDAALERRLGRAALHRDGVSNRLHDPLPPVPAPLSVAGARTIQAGCFLMGGH